MRIIILYAMRNLGESPKHQIYPLLGWSPEFCWLSAMCQNTTIYYVFATLAPQKHPKRSILAIFGPTMSAAPQFGVKVGPNLV